MKLKSCPLCGGKAILHTVGNHSKHHSVGFSFEVECEDCGIKLPKTYQIDFSLTENGEVNILNDTRTEAVTAWNTRKN